MLSPFTTTDSTSGAAWSRHRSSLCRDPHSINLNAGTLHPTPRIVLDAVTKLREQQASNPSDFCWRQLPKLLERSRDRLAEYLNAKSDELYLLPNVTIAMNIVAASIELPAGSEILTTDHEYGAMNILWKRIAEQRGLKVRMLELPFRTENPNDILDVFSREMRDETKLVFFSHCNASTGLVMPAKKLTAMARQRGAIVAIDGAHAPGNVPVDIGDIDADYYGANGHKWIMAPCGAGFLHVRANAKITSLITSWGYEFDRNNPHADSGGGGTVRQRDVEFHGTADRCPQMVFQEALDFRDSLGGDAAISARYRPLVEYARERLAAIGLKPATPKNEAMSGCIIAFDFPCDDPVAFRDAIWTRHHIECPVTVAAGKTFLRVCCAWFNEQSEIDRLAEALRNF